MFFPAFDNAVRMLTTLPGIGQRGAHRIVFHLLKSDPFQVEQLARSIVELKETIRFCEECGGFSETNICNICSDERRDAASLCVVEEPQDIFAIEKTGEFKGRYHVLFGALSPLDGIGPNDLRIEELMKRVSKIDQGEIFIATNPTMEGDATASYIADRLNARSLKITRISHGIATGASIEYADSSTLALSIRNRYHWNGRE